MKASFFWVLMGMLPGIPRMEAQVAIYGMEFEKTGDSINYRAYDGGYLVAPLDGAPADLVLLLGREFVVAEEAVAFFVATSGSERKMVLANAGGDGTPLQFFSAIGKIDATVEGRVSQPGTGGTGSTATVTARVPSLLRGYVLTADDTGTGASAVFVTVDAGAAGFSEWTVRLDRTRTNEATRNGRDKPGAVADIVASLERLGFSNATPVVPGDEDDEQGTTEGSTGGGPSSGPTGTGVAPPGGATAGG